MKRRRSSSRQSAANFSLFTVSLLFTAVVGVLFYFFYEESISLELEKNSHDVDVLRSSLQATLNANERFFLAASHEDIAAAAVKQECQEYLRLHREIARASVKENGVVEWALSRDSSLDIYLQLHSRSGAFLSFPETWRSVSYSKPFPVGTSYYFSASFPGSANSRDTLTIVYSAEEFLKGILLSHPMENGEVSLFSGIGESIASTGFSNAPSYFRIQRAVQGYEQLLSVDIADTRFSFWTPSMIVGASICALLIVALFALLFALQRDVKKLRSAQSSLRSSEERFRTIFEGSADGIRLMDRYGRTVMVNSAYCDLVKTSSEELLREYNDGNENLEARYASNSAFRSQFDAGTLKMPATQTMKRRGGEEIPVEVSHSFIDVGGGEKLLLSIFRDVSEKRKLEMDALQVQKMDALGEFAVGIGNSLKNVSGIILNSAEMIGKESSYDARLSHYVAMVVAESKRTSELADDLLIFARSKVTEHKPIVAERMISQAQKILEHSLPPSCRLSVVSGDNFATVNGDVHQLHQAIVNIALTAQQRMPDGGEIKIESSIADPETVKRRSPLLEGKELLAITISDNGKELDEYSQRRIFEPYFNARSTDQSSGLRLSVAYGIVQRHSGFVDVKSKKGTGTSITIFLPVIGHEKPEAVKGETQAAEGGNECLLIVDDEESFRELYEQGLVSVGYKVYTAQDGERAFTVYQEHRAEIDLVVTDLMMPKVNGEELITKILSLNPAAKTILVTGAIDLKAKAEFLKLGIRDIIMKPFLFDELMASVRKVLDTQ
ncbi:MAG TPA: response regulator [Bacteroidota bacterium]|nr:response regulator [Bacteroidota bacterium]